MPHSATVERTDAELIAAVLGGDTASFEPLLKKYQPRVFATARRYARRESEVEDIVQEVFLKAFHKLNSFRGDAPFEHWLMRLAVRTCYDFLRAHQRNREMSFADFTDEQTDWLDRFAANPADAGENAAAARELVEKVLAQLSPAARLVGTRGQNPRVSRQGSNAKMPGETGERKVFVTHIPMKPSNSIVLL